MPRKGFKPFGVDAPAEGACGSATDDISATPHADLAPDGALATCTGTGTLVVAGMPSMLGGTDTTAGHANNGAAITAPRTPCLDNGEFPERCGVGDCERPEYSGASGEASDKAADE